MIKVSVIVPCYNQGVYLSETLESVLKQSYDNWECIIVNDGSTDNTETIANTFLQKDKRFKYVYQQNAGLSAARNIGVKNSSGEYILPLDSDDLIHSDYMKLALKAFEDNPNLKIVYSKAALFGVRKGEWILPEYSMERMLGRNCIFCSAFYRREDYNTTNGYNSNMKYGFEDWDFWLSLLENGGDVFQIPQILFFYRIRKKSMFRYISKENFIFIRKQIWNNHKELYATNFLNPLECFEYVAMIDFFPIRIIRKLFGL